MRYKDVLPSPSFPRPLLSRAASTNEPGVGFLLVSLDNDRRFFCPAKESRPIQTQFQGGVRKVYEASFQQQDDTPSTAVVIFGGRMLRYDTSCPLALKTSRLDLVKREAQWQGCAMGELVGEDPVKEIASLQLLQGDGGGHHGVEEIIEAMSDGSTLYKISPWYEGGELFDLAPLAEESAKPIFSQILDAVNFLHDRGVCHRDISLENILMDTSTSCCGAKRGCSMRSGSISSVGSSITVSSDDTEPDSTTCDRDEDDEEEEASGGGGSSTTFGSFSPRSYTPPSSPRDSSSTAYRRKGGDVEVGGEWFGNPRLCDFGMSVRIPTSPTGGKARLTPQGRCGKSTCVAPEVFYDEAFDGHAIDTWSIGTTLFMALLGVQPWEEIGDFKFQAIAEGKNLDVVLQGWKLRDAISDEAVDLLQAMLTADPEERLSDIKSILAHPWFQSNTSTLSN